MAFVVVTFSKIIYIVDFYYFPNFPCTKLDMENEIIDPFKNLSLFVPQNTGEDSTEDFSDIDRHNIISVGGS